MPWLSSWSCASEEAGTCPPCPSGLVPARLAPTAPLVGAWSWHSPRMGWARCIGRQLPQLQGGGSWPALSLPAPVAPHDGSWGRDCPLLPQLCLHRSWGGGLTVGGGGEGPGWGPCSSAVP